MKILQICSAKLVGGGETHLADLSAALAERGHELFFALRPNSPVPSILHDVSTSHIVNAGMVNAADIASAFRIARFARRNRVDILHAHIARDYPIAAAASMFSGIPFVLTRHLLFPMKRLQKAALRRTAGVIAPSKAIFDALTADRIFPAEKITLIPHGIDTDRWARPLERRGRKFTVGSVGHLSPIKGFDVLLHAAAAIGRSRPDLRFTIVGEDKSPGGRNRLELEKLIFDLDLKDRVEMTGWTDDVRAEFAEMDIFVSAARVEAFGLVIAEAMAAGLPVIASRSEGALEMIEDGVSGVLVPLEDASALADAVLALADDVPKQMSLVKNARSRVRARFSLERMAAETEDFYRSVLKREK
jgi:glycosyltransferase involved in cell wall biosynthesis